MTQYCVFTDGTVALTGFIDGEFDSWNGHPAPEV